MEDFNRRVKFSTNFTHPMRLLFSLSVIFAFGVMISMVCYPAVGLLFAVLIGWLSTAVGFVFLLNLHLFYEGFRKEVLLKYFDLD